MAITNEELMREVNRRSLETARAINAWREVLTRNPTVNYTNGFIAWHNALGTLRPATLLLAT